jgi:protocatechuate 3,4-dioxygenase beta subunit
MSAHDDLHDHDLGLSHDLPRILGRRRLLTVLGGVGATVAVAACGSDDGTSPTASSDGQGGSSSQTDATVADGEIPEETAGPFPGDGSNGVNVLAEDGVVRRDIRSSFGSASGAADGVPMTIRFDLGDAATGAALASAAVYVWHCDREGRYSRYSEGATDQNYLRGVQAADADGLVTFTSIYPACYSGRWPHIHFEVYPSVDDATASSNLLATSQIALTENVCDTVYATDGYEQSRTNMTQVSLASDMVFSDGVDLETPTVTGSVADGYVVTLPVRVA